MFYAAIHHLVSADLSVNTLACFESFPAQTVPSKSSDLQMFSNKELAFSRCLVLRLDDLVAVNDETVFHCLSLTGFHHHASSCGSGWCHASTWDGTLTFHSLAHLGIWIVLDVKESLLARVWRTDMRMCSESGLYSASWTGSLASLYAVVYMLYVVVVLYIT